MVLYKSTADGQIPMTEEEEAQIRADWAAAEKEAKKPKPKTIDDIVKDFEKRISALEKAK